ncbi:MAG: tyrosine-type recombinase/integrase [Chthoniobacter sp.]|uniref:tyrosine-type recombinase/integrase n=1 Tax=Chthoniobacter sp. TaxID=2510640 RepID=UPI0032A9E957
MKRKSKARTAEWPVEIKVGSVTAKIYRSVARGRELFTVAYRDTNNRRVKKSFADFGSAKLEAQGAATKIQNGQIDVLELTSEDRIVYQHSIELLRPSGQPLDSAAAQFAEAFRILGGAGSVVEAARYFSKHHPVALPRKTIAKVYEEFLASKISDNASTRYVQDIRSRLGRCSRHFAEDISDLTTAELENWLAALNVGPVARNSARSLLITLFNFARQKGYLPKSQPTEAEAIPVAKELPTTIGIFTPIQMTSLLSAASDENRPYLAIGAFAGLRHAELMRLSWDEVHISHGYIEVTAAKAKTAQRRIIPIQPNLKSWLKRIAKSKGPLFSGDGSRFLRKVTRTAETCGFDWPQNGLRHSFASYRLAKCRSAAEVALEMGNSPRMVFQHYRELVTPADSDSWWEIAP